MHMQVSQHLGLHSSEALAAEARLAEGRVRGGDQNTTAYQDSALKVTHSFILQSLQPHPSPLILTLPMNPKP